MSDCSKPRAIGIVLEPDSRNRRAILEALQSGRRFGLRAAQDAVEQARRELVAVRGEAEALRAQLTRAQERYRIAKEIIARADAIDAMHERDPMVTLH
jgi:hypothetical protein